MTKQSNNSLRSDVKALGIDPDVVENIVLRAILSAVPMDAPECCGGPCARSNTDKTAKVAKVVKTAARGPAVHRASVRCGAKSRGVLTKIDKDVTCQRCLKKMAERA